MSERSAANYLHDHESTNYVMFVQTINGESVKTKMPRAQAEALRQMADAQIDQGVGTSAAVVPQHEAVAVRHQAGGDVVEKVHLAKRAARMAFIGMRAVAVVMAGDYAYTSMNYGEVPGPEVIIEDMWELPGQVIEVGQNFGGFVEQVKGTIDTFSKLGGGK